MKSIILSGLPFTGKTTVSIEIAKKLSWPLVDTDVLLEDRYRLSCTEQFKQFGEQGFRENEYTLLQELEQNTSQRVISLGGGALTYPLSAETVKKLGFLVCIECSLEVLNERVKSCSRIPAYLNTLDLEGSLKTLYEKRKEHYRQYGDFFLDVTFHTPVQSAIEIVEEYKRRYGK